MLEGKHWHGSKVLFSCHVISLLNMLQMLTINHVSSSRPDKLINDVSGGGLFWLGTV